MEGLVMIYGWDIISVNIITVKQNLFEMNHQEDSESDGDEVFAQPNQVYEVKEDPEVYIEKKILEAYEEEERGQSKINVLSEDVQFKLKEVLDDIKDDEGKNFQSIITLRMKELAYSKILVLTYEKTFFRLVLALFHIGKQYLKFNCLDQAITHLQNAISKNVKASQSPTNKLFHSYLLTYLGEACFKAGKLKEASIELQKALNIQNDHEQSMRIAINNIKTLTVTAKLKAKQQNPEATQYIQAAVRKAKEVVGQNSRAYGLTLYDQATILRGQKDAKKDEVIRLYQQAIKSIKMSNEPESELDIINIYEDMSSLYKQSGDAEKLIQAMKLKYQIFEDTYGNADKKSIKQQRALATTLLNCKKIEQSLDQFDDILQKSQKVYGENSLQVGKQYKTIGNIYVIKGDPKLAESNFKKALKIFHDLGDQRLAKQIRMKISSIQIQ